jgi:hypothetical protein
MKSKTETLAAAMRKVITDEPETEDDEPLTIEQSLRIELAWRTLERDRAMAELKHLSRRCAKCVDAPLD